MLRLTVFLHFFFVVTLGHLRMREPPNRSSVWRDPGFAHFKPTKNYEDSGLNCGNKHEQEVVVHCGVCGDSGDNAMPRPNETGGKYGQGIIVAYYEPGQVIPINIEFTTAHSGYFEMHLCETVPESEDCFRVLQFEDGETTMTAPEQGQTTWLNTTLQIPDDASCEQCVLRLHYRAGNGWGDCGNGKHEKGCGPQETYRNCADISIQSFK